MYTKTAVGVGLKISHNPLYLVGQKKIVRIQQGNDLAPAGGKSCIKARTLSPIRFADEVQTRILALILLNHLNRVVGGPVVADDEFDIGIGLAESTLERVPDVSGVVVIGDQNRNQRLCGARAQLDRTELGDGVRLHNRHKRLMSKLRVESAPQRLKPRRFCVRYVRAKARTLHGSDAC